ncbi:helix-turn-helix transcriptional regulator [Microterricola viridarii]|uniref:DNA-binding response regulator, NarL/FixJ family, contains REC and HTH domains n=1 Tax=Microterricola viridarii TaxID=412690 RepID=A0A1H1Z239_9MICO|nr:LuxR C-terminal-related transcriptional regulator [Microterricola viridarii]SDT27667.1 DNA-binding response regulator, NarL/FixJ family, contains REC and HTH domains [Microterricola viridarii]
MTRIDAPGGTRRSAASTRPIRIGICDERVLLLDSIAAWIIEKAPEFDVVVRAERWIDLVRNENFPTALVLMGEAPTEQVSLEARIRTCRAAGARVIVMSAQDTEGAAERAVAAGAVAFLSKADSMETFHAVARQAMGLDPREPVPADAPATGRVAAAAGAGAGAAASEEATEIIRPKLSPGELESLRLYAAGNTTAAVARLMNVKYETAKTYLRRVREKYARANRPASRRAELIIRAAEDGYLQ